MVIWFRCSMPPVAHPIDSGNHEERENQHDCKPDEEPVFGEVHRGVNSRIPMTFVGSDRIRTHEGDESNEGAVSPAVR